MSAITAPRYRAHPWINIKDGTKRHGIQASIEKGKWMHMAEDGNPLIFDSEAERDAKLKELRQRKGDIQFSLTKVSDFLRDKP